MSNRVGICSACDRSVGLVTIGVNHTGKSARVAGWHPLNESQQACPGAHQPALLTREQRRRERVRATYLDALLEPFRLHAAVALDAWIERRAYADTEILLRVSLWHYKRHFPDVRATEAMRSVQINPARTTSRLWDVYCTFCGVLLYRKMSSLDYTDGLARFRELARSNQHAVECALKHLAFALEPAAPTVRRLPDEFAHDQASP